MQRGCMGLQPAKEGRAAVIERDAVVLAAHRGLHALERAWLGLGSGLGLGLVLGSGLGLG